MFIRLITDGAGGPFSEIRNRGKGEERGGKEEKKERKERKKKRKEKRGGEGKFN
jgi:hypothetical protein